MVPGQLHLNSTVLLATVPGAGQAQKLYQGKYFSHKPPPEPAVKPVLSLPKDLVERTVAESGGNHIVCYFRVKMRLPWGFLRSRHSRICDETCLDISYEPGLFVKLEG